MPNSPATAERVDAVLAEVHAAGAIEDERGERRELDPAGVARAQGEALAELVAAEGAESSVEIGFALGLSCLHICSGLLRAGGERPRHLAIDPTESWYWGNAGRRLVERAALGDVVELVEQESQLLLPRLIEEGRRFDLAFIDGDHRFDPAFIDIWCMTRLVRLGGLILVDDMWMPAVRLAVAYFEANAGLELLPDAMPGAFRWKRRGLSRGVRRGKGHTAVLRQPAEPVERAWDHFTDFRR